jgi:hypothetical protein
MKYYIKKFGNTKYYACKINNTECLGLTPFSLSDTIKAFVISTCTNNYNPCDNKIKELLEVVK